METFTFKRGPIVSNETWTVYPSRIEGADKHMDFKAMTHAHFAYLPQARLTISQLVLCSGEETLKLQCNAQRGSESHRAFAGLIEAVLVNLKHENPSLTFTPPPSNQIAMRVGQVSGLIPALFGLNFIFQGIKDSSGFAIGMGVFFILMGWFMAWSFSPGTATPQSIEETMQYVVRVYRL
ncbi:MAG: hypothetical protein ACFB0D_09310 [Phormidesmis sp.]